MFAVSFHQIQHTKKADSKGLAERSQFFWQVIGEFTIHIRYGSLPRNQMIRRANVTICQMIQSPTANIVTVQPQNHGTKMA